MRTAYIDAMTRYVDFRSRTSRRSYWLFQLMLVLYSFLAAFMDALLNQGDVLILAVQLVHLIPVISATIRRLRDAGRSPWWFLAIFTGIGIIPVMIFLCQATAKHLLPIADSADAGLPAGSTPEPPRYQIQDLQQLAIMHEKGQLNDDEFARLKAEIFAQREPASS